MLSALRFTVAPLQVRNTEAFAGFWLFAHGWRTCAQLSAVQGVMAWFRAHDFSLAVSVSMFGGTACPFCCADPWPSERHRGPGGVCGWRRCFRIGGASPFVVYI